MSDVATDVGMAVVGTGGAGALVPSVGWEVWGEDPGSVVGVVDARSASPPTSESEIPRTSAMARLRERALLENGRIRIQGSCVANGEGAPHAVMTAGTSARGDQPTGHLG